MRFLALISAVAALAAAAVPHSTPTSDLFGRACYPLDAYCYEDNQCCTWQCDSQSHRCADHIDIQECPKYFDPDFLNTGCDLEKIHDPCAWGLCDDKQTQKYKEGVHGHKGHARKHG